MFSDPGVARVNSGKQAAPLHPLISLKTTPRSLKPGGFRVPPSAEENVNRCFLPWVAWLLTSLSAPHRLDCVQEAQVFWVSPCQGLWTPFDLPDHIAALQYWCMYGVFMIFFFFCFETGTHYVTHVTLADLRRGWPRIQRFRDPSASASLVLRLKACATVPSELKIF